MPLGARMTSSISRSRYVYRTCSGWLLVGIVIMVGTFVGGGLALSCQGG